MDFLINAEKREKKGTSSSRNIRRDGFVPGIIYGAGKEEQTISLRKHEVAKNLEQDAFYSQVLDISLDGKKEQVILRDIQCRMMCMKLKSCRTQKVLLSTSR